MEVATRAVKTIGSVVLFIAAGCTGAPVTPGMPPAPAAVRESTAAALGTAERLFVADTPNNRVELYNVGDAVPVGSIDASMNAPEGIALDGEGTLYVANAGAASVTEYAKAPGRVTLSIATAAQPYGVAVDAQRNLYVSSLSAKNVSEYRAGATTASRSIGGFRRPMGIAVDVRGNLFVADAAAGRLFEVPRGSTKPQAIFHQLINPQAVSVAGSGKNETLYVSSLDKAVVYVFKLGTEKAEERITSSLLNPTFTAVAATGEFFISDNSGNVYAYPAGGRFAVERIAGFGNPAGLAVEPADLDADAARKPPARLYVGSHYQNDVLVYSIPELTQLGTISTGITSLADIAGATDGTLYVLNGETPSGSATIAEYSYGATSPRKSFAIQLSGYGAPYGIAVDRRSNIYVLWYSLGSRGGAVTEYPPGATKPSRTITSKRFHLPRSIATDAAGKLYVCDSSASAVFEIDARSHLTRLQLRGINDPTSIAFAGWGLNRTTFVGAQVPNEFLMVPGVAEYLPGQTIANQFLENGLSNEPTSLAATNDGQLFVDGSPVVAYPPYATGNTNPKILGDGGAGVAVGGI